MERCRSLLLVNYIVQSLMRYRRQCRSSVRKRQVFHEGKKENKSKEKSLNRYNIIADVVLIEYDKRQSVIFY